jgi:hypothetical protein
LPTLATAAPIVALGSSFDLLVAGSSSGLSFFDDIVFDGMAETRTRSFAGGGSVELTLDERQTDLGGGRHSLWFSIEGVASLFPVAGESGSVRLGGFGDGLDLLAEVRLDNVVTRLLDGDGNLIVSGGEAGGPGSWSGLWPEVLLTAGFSGIGGSAARRFEFELFVTEVGAVPAPGSAALAGLGLLAVAAGGLARRRAG